MKVALTEVEKKFILDKYIKSGLSYKKAKDKLTFLIMKIKSTKPQRKLREVVIMDDDFKMAFKKIAGIM